MAIKQYQHDKRDLRVRINMDAAPRGMELLTPNGSLHWKDCIFDFNPPSGGQTDFSVVLANARPNDCFLGSRSNTLFIAGEPPEKKIYPTRFYAQFAHVVDTHPLSNHPNLHLNAPGLNWHVGLDLTSRTYRYGYDYLIALGYPQKQNKVAVVCSNASHTIGQRRRLAFLDQLKQRLGDRIVHFGRGFTPIDDKMNAILPYRYHLVLENSQSPHYWTEKLADAYLGWAFPLYLGCPNIHDYFPNNSLEILDGDDVDAAEQRIRVLLDKQLEQNIIEAISYARDQVLNHYNPFAWSAYWAHQLYQPGKAENICIRIHKAFRPFPRGEIYRVRQLIANLRKK